MNKIITLPFSLDEEPMQFSGENGEKIIISHRILFCGEQNTNIKYFQENFNVEIEITSSNTITIKSIQNIQQQLIDSINNLVQSVQNSLVKFRELLSIEEENQKLIDFGTWYKSLSKEELAESKPELIQQMVQMLQ